MKTKAHPTPYLDLNVVLHDLVTRVRSILGDRFTGAYLQGSFAIGDFDIYSDVDFVILIENDVTGAELRRLRSMHRAVFNMPSPWAQHLEGSYIPKIALGQPPPPTRQFLYLDHGAKELIRSDHDDSLVVYWTLRQKGVVLAGPSPPELVPPISSDALRREMLETMATWRQEFLDNPSRLNNRFYQPFAVLSYCRMLSTLETGTVVSKLAGATWAKTALDSRWHHMIQHAIESRPGDAAVKVRQPADPDDLAHTWEFMTYALGFARGIGSRSGFPAADNQEGLR